MSGHKRFINNRKYHFENMMHGYGVNERIPLKIARMYYGIATHRAEEYVKEEISDMDREWAKTVAGRECTVKEILEIKGEMNDWIDEKEKIYG